MENKLLNRPTRSGSLVLSLVGGLLLGFSSVACSYERAYEKTPVDEVSLKLIPESKILVTEGSGNYFNQDNGLFMRLFRYIQANNVEMTTPVEASIDNANMVFYVGLKDSGKELEDRDQVRVVEKKSRLVVALGARGAYTDKNFNRIKLALEKWLEKQTNIKPTGEAYAVFWDGPYMPSALKRFEVHIPVKALDVLTDGKVVQGKKVDVPMPPAIPEEDKSSSPSTKRS